MHKQEETEPVDEFITDLYLLTKHCGYNDLHDEMIRDRIAVGIQDSRLSEKLQMKSDLTLERAVTLVRQSESVKTQQPTVRGQLPKEDLIGTVRGIKASSRGQNKGPQANQSSQGAKPCGRCGKQGPHNKEKCPAKDSVCYKCGKLGHFKSVCRNKST